ncbi:MAG: hypothetical protein ACKOCM_08790 [Cyanobacteriota bacterium]
MKDSNANLAPSLAGPPGPFLPADSADGWDESLRDEPLASGQRKRYLASLGSGAARI